MKTFARTTFAALTVTSLLAAAAFPTQAQAKYPEKPVSIVVLLLRADPPAAPAWP